MTVGMSAPPWTISMTPNSSDRQANIGNPSSRLGMQHQAIPIAAATPNKTRFDDVCPR